MAAQVVFYIAKLLEILGMLALPTALYYGMTLTDGTAMVVELKIMVLGIALFGIGRSLETATGRQE